MMKPSNLDSSGNSDSLLWPVFASMPAFLMQFLVGSIESHSAVLIPQLEDSNKFTITLDQNSWIASLGIMATPIVSILSGFVMDRYGRKTLLYLFFILSSLGYFFIAFAQTVERIYIGRILCATAHGVVFCSLSYIYEVSASHQRSKLVALFCPMCCFGQILIYVIGGYLPWEIASLIFAIFGVVGLVSVFFIPESPAWYVTQGNINAAIESLEWLKRGKRNIVDEVDKLQDSCSDKDLPQRLNFQNIVHPTIWKPFVILSIFAALQTGAGYYMVLYYTVDFFKNIDPSSDINPLSITVGVNAMRVVSGSIGSYLITRCSRKRLTATTAFGMFVIALAVIALLNHQSHNPISERTHWLLVFCSCSYILVCTLAVQPLPWLMIGELYPLKLRGVMSGVSFFCIFTTIFIGVKIYPFLMFYTHIIGIFCIFAASCLLMVFLALFFLPETYDKTQQEIEEYFMKRKKDSANLV